MYSVLFTSVLVVILIWKSYKLIKNKRNSGDFESIDQDLVTMLNEGDQIG